MCVHVYLCVCVCYSIATFSDLQQTIETLNISLSESAEILQAKQDEAAVTEKQLEEKDLQIQEALAKVHLANLYACVCVRCNDNVNN